jgi:O-antigen/teichoic acid export membrane protein
MSPVASQRRYGVGGNALILFLGTLIPAVVAFLCMPAVLRSYGTERIGLLSLLLIVVAYFTLLDLGLSRALTKMAAEALSRGQSHRVPALFWTALVAQTALGAAGAVALAAISPFLVERVLNVPPHLRSEAQASLLIACASLPVVIAASSTAGLLQAGQRFDLAVFAQLPAGIANSLLPLLLSRLTNNLALVMLGILLARAASFLLLLFAAHRVFPSLRSRRFESEEFWRLLRYGGWIAVGSVVTPLLVYADRFVIGTFLTMSAVAYYAVPADLASRMLTIPAAITTAIFPVLSSGPVPGEADPADSLVSQSLKYILCAVGIPAALLSAYAFDALSLWLGAEFARNAAANFRVLLVGIVINSLGFVFATLVQARGRPDLTGRLQVVELPVYMLAAWIGARAWGLPGVALAWTARVAIDAVVLLRIASTVGSLSPRRFASNGVLAAIVLVAATWCAAMATTFVQEPAWRLAGATVISLVAAWSAWRHVLDDADRGQIGAMLRGRVRGDIGGHDR